MYIKKKIGFIAICLLQVSFIFSDNNFESNFRFGIQSAYYFPNHNGATSNNGFESINYDITEKPVSFVAIGNDNGRSLGNGWGGIELQFWTDYNLNIPLFRSSNGMLSTNGLDINLKVSISPVSMGLDSYIRFTPIAFLSFDIGGHIGTGWSIPGLGNGLGLNNSGSGNPNETSFPGVVIKNWFSGTFQFDLSPLLKDKSDWTHIVFVSNAKFIYQDFSAASSTDAWQYLSDNGENHNGWKFQSSSVLGYYMPAIPISFIGFLLESDANIGNVSAMSRVDSGGWGSDFVKYQFGPIINWDISENHSLKLLVQWANGNQYDSSSIYYNYFKNRNSTGNSFIYFNRVALSYTINF